MLNKVMLLNSADSQMGWVIEVAEFMTYFTTYGAAENYGSISAFGKAPEINYIMTISGVDITMIQLGENILQTGIVYRKDKDIRYDLAQGQNFILFSKDDVGKTITVYYLPV